MRIISNIIPKTKSDCPIRIMNKNYSLCYILAILSAIYYFILGIGFIIYWILTSKIEEEEEENSPCSCKCP